MAVTLNEVFGSPIFFFILGLIMGSFGNVLIARLPTGEGIVGRSHCPHCKKKLSVPELIPVISYILLRGRCSGCGKTISVQYPLVELGSGGLFLLASTWHSYFPHALLLALTLWLLFLIAVIDYKEGVIPDALSVPLIFLGIVYSTIVHTFPLQGILIGTGVFAAQWILSRGRWVGSGDIFLGAGIGALMGTWQMTLLWLWLAYVSGAAIATILLITGSKHIKSTLPFGPFMAGSAAVTLMVGEWILRFV